MTRGMGFWRERSILRITLAALLTPMRSRFTRSVDRQVIEIGHVAHDAAIHQLIDERLSHAIDIHDAAGGEVEQGLLEAGGTVGIDAAAGGLALLAHHLAAADGAMGGHAERLPVRALGGDADHFGNDVAGAFDHHLVADLQAEALDLILVVERGAGDGDAADLHGFEVGDRGQGSGAAHLDLNGFHRGGGLSRGVLVGDGPAGSFGGEAELALLLHGIHLDDDAIDFVRQLFALGFPGIAELDDFVDGAADFAVRVDLEAQMAQFLERAPMAVEGRAAFGEQEVGVVFEAASGGKLRLQQAERAGGGVARIGKAGEALFFALGIEAFEGAAVHDGFAADLEGGQPALHAKRKGADGAGIFGDVFAHGAISAGDGLGEFAVAIVGGHGEPVQLEFGDVAVFGAAEEFADAAVEIAEFGFVEGVIEAEQGRAVLDLDEALARLPADALGGRIRR